MTRRLLLRLVSSIFFLPPREFFLAAASSLFLRRACIILRFSLFLLVGRMVDIISAAAFHRIDPSRIIGAKQQEETYTTADSDDESRVVQLDRDYVVSLANFRRDGSTC